MRIPVIAGNWKMNKTNAEAKEFLNSFLKDFDVADPEVVICPPFTTIPSAVELTKGTNVGVGAQNMYFEDSGAYTGEVTADMLKEIGCEYVILGHSERRKYFAETDETVNLKTKKALEKGLTPIVCVGETLEEREADKTLDVIDVQVKKALEGIEATDKIIIAYEPVWAIGTGKTATDDQAEEVCKVVRELLADIFDQETADKIRVLYGGSVNTSNVKNLMSMPNIDGALVGGASIKKDFVELVNYKK